MAKKSKKPRKYLKQSDVPSCGLEQALRVARAIADSYGKQPTRPLLVAQAMDLGPSASQFRALCGASIAYGLTTGGSNAKAIELTPLARRIVAPTVEEDDDAAKREAVLRPRVLREFLTHYDGSPLPAERIAKNVLEEMGVPHDRATATYQLICTSAEAVGFLRDIKGNKYVDLKSDAGGGPEPSTVEGSTAQDHDAVDGAIPLDPTQKSPPPDGSAEEAGVLASSRREATSQNGRVFITHGSDGQVVSQLKELLTFGGFTPVVAQEQETVSKPVPDKVLDDMRSCSAAIVHVGTEQRVLDEGGNEHRMLNQNVLIEIGAAMALYGRRFILLVESGVKLPSNLQGLYEVRYNGGELGYEATMKLLRAFNGFRG